MIRSYQHFLLEKKENLILYHGSLERFDHFTDNVTFFTKSIDFAYDYAQTKSIDMALDKEPIVYKCRVHTKIFDINNKEDYKKLENNLPDKITIYNSTGMFSAEVDKETVLQYMKGYTTKEPYEPAVKAKIGDVISSPEYKYHKLKIFKKDENYAYAYRIDEYERFISTFTTKIGELYTSYLRDAKKIYQPLVEEIEKYLKEKYNKSYIIEPDIFTFLKGYLYNEDQEDEQKVEYFKEKLEEYNQKVLEYMIDKGYGVKKFNLKPQIKELKDTWTYFENGTVMNIILKLGYGGYVALERDHKTYAIFNPKEDVKILEVIG